MKHIDDIRTFIRTLCRSAKFHALVIRSSPGWSKSTTVESALTEMGSAFHNLGSYSTALELYNAMCAHRTEVLLIDDAAGIFNQPIAMALLKAATWPHAGSNGERVIAWRSSSDKVLAPSVVYNGKVILLTNSLPSSLEVTGFLSRTLCLEITFEHGEIEKMLLEAAQQREFYDDTNLATEVATHLVKSYSDRDASRLNLRTLQIAYEVARINPSNWPELIEKVLPPSIPQQLIKSLHSSGASVEVQASKFAALTGRSRRTFFEYRKMLGIQRNRRGVGLSEA